MELGAEKVPLAQKQLIKLTNDRGKVVITATQMLESMIYSQRPTRAEASDVANAVLDGTDALMLSGETAVGEHPALVVRTMDRIIREVEQSPEFRHSIETPELDLPVPANAISHAAVIAGQQMGLTAIAVVTHSGGAARLMSEYRPESGASSRSLGRNAPSTDWRLYWGIEPVLTPLAATNEELFAQVERTLRERNMAASGDFVVVTAGVPVGAGETTNMLKIHRMP